MICIYFHPIHGLPFHSIDCVLLCTEVFNVDVVQLIYFFFCHHIQVKLRNYCQIQCHKVTPMFSSKSFIVFALIFRSLIHSEFIFVNGIISVQLHSFPCQYSVFPAPFAEMIILSLLNGFATLVENHPTTYARVYFLALCVNSLAYVSVFMPVPHCFDYFSFVESFEISDYETSNFLLFQDCFWLLGVCWILNFMADFFLLL